MTERQLVLPRRAPAGAAAGLRRHPHVGRQRPRHRDPRPARRRRHARRADHQRQRLRRRRPPGRRDPRRAAGDRRRGLLRRAPARRHAPRARSCSHPQTHSLQSRRNDDADPSSVLAAALAVADRRRRPRRLRRRQQQRHEQQPAPTSSSTSRGRRPGHQANPANGRPTITIGSKNFTEEFILGEIYAQALQAAGYKVKKQLNLGSEQIALKALKSGPDRRLPGVHRHGADHFCKVKTDARPQRPGRGLQRRPRPLRPRRASPPCRPRRSPTPTASR